jgi:hypothetical protein
MLSTKAKFTLLFQKVSYIKTPRSFVFWNHTSFSLHIYEERTPGNKTLGSHLKCAKIGQAHPTFCAYQHGNIFIQLGTTYVVEITLLINIVLFYQQCLWMSNSCYHVVGTAVDNCLWNQLVNGCQNSVVLHVVLYHAYYIEQTTCIFLLK